MMVVITVVGIVVDITVLNSLGLVENTKVQTKNDFQNRKMF